MQHSLLTCHLKCLRRSYVASPTAFLILGLLSKHLTFHYRVVGTNFSWLYQDILPLNHRSHTYMIPSRTRTGTFLTTPSVSFRCLFQSFNELIFIYNKLSKIFSDLLHYFLHFLPFIQPSLIYVSKSSFLIFLDTSPFITQQVPYWEFFSPC